MKILVYDNNTTYKNNLDEVIEFFSFAVTISRAKDYDDCLTLYKNDTYDLVLVDVSNDIGFSLVKYFLEQFKEQKLIALATKPINFGIESCEYCQAQLKFKVLMRPIRQEEFVHILRDNFTCEFYKLSRKEIETLSVFKKVVFDYPFIKYDKSKKLFCLEDRLLDSQRLSCLVDLTRELEEKNITFKVEDMTVQITTTE